jgi:hypothetical protein
VPIVLKSGSLNLLEPSGPVKACNGIALPLPFFNLSAEFKVILHSNVHVNSLFIAPNNNVLATIISVNEISYGHSAQCALDIRLQGHKD